MGLSSGRFVASPLVDIVRVVSVHGICGCVSIPLLMLLPCTVLDVGVGMITFSVKKNNNKATLIIIISLGQRVQLVLTK